MTKKELHIDYITYNEGEQVVSYAPQLELCFNAPKKDDSIKSLKAGTKMLMDVWKEKKVLSQKIETLGLTGSTTDIQRSIIQHNLTIPLYAAMKEYEVAAFSLDVEVD